MPDHDTEVYIVVVRRVRKRSATGRGERSAQELAEALHNLAVAGVEEFSNADVLALCPAWSDVAMCRALRRTADRRRTIGCGLTLQRVGHGRYRFLSSTTHHPGRTRL